MQMKYTCIPVSVALYWGIKCQMVYTQFDMPCLSEYEFCQNIH